ncbi:MAG: helix-turn-helix transcriptional regulator [Gemmatimonadaceae bacterium]|nr:helix-turn-helix transcriptional regulator [Gemmatimonadaceae bacterium]
MCHGVQMTGVARMVREFPRVPTVALLSQFDRATVRTVLSLGQCGIRTLIDVREPNGWRELRAVLLNERTSDVQRLAMSRLALDLAQAPAGTRRFFDTLFALAARTPTIRQFARSLEIVPGTLMSRFYRAQLPPPKRFLAFARLSCAARLFENPGVSVSSVSDQLCYSSPQSFSRHVRSILGMSAIQFRVRYDCEGMLDAFREELVLRHLSTWRAFDPFGHTARSIGIRKSENRRRVVTFPEPALPLRSVAEELSGGEQREDLSRPGE